MLPERLNPVVLTEAATRKLARHWLLLLCALYIAAGLLGRDPWNNDDVAGFASMMYAVHQGGSAWFMPHIGGLSYFGDGPLTHLSGALLIKGLGWLLTPELAARLSTAAWLALSFMAVWYGTYLLGRRTDAQPVALPFGGTPSSTSYGRTLADVGLLLLLACPGIVLRTHETSGAPLAFASACVLYYGLARVLDKPMQGAWALSGAIVIGALGESFLTATMPIAALLLAAAVPAYQARRKTIFSSLISGCSAVTLALWCLHALNPVWVNGWLLRQTEYFGVDLLSFTIGWLRDVLWLAWPAAVFGLVGLWRWRHRLGAPLLQVPLVMIAGAVTHTLISRSFDDADRLLVAVPVVMLGSLALPTLRRALLNLLDAISLLGYSIAMLCWWIIWIAIHFNFPAQIAQNVERQTPGMIHTIVPLYFVISLVCTMLWLGLCVWRIRRTPKVLWRGPLLACAGAVLSWTILMTLFLPELNYTRSSKVPMQKLAVSMSPVRCVSITNLDSAQAASLWLATRIELSTTLDCPAAVQYFNARPSALAKQNSRHQTAPNTVAPVGMVEVMSATRLSDKRERFVLFRQTSTTPVQ